MIHRTSEPLNHQSIEPTIHRTSDPSNQRTTEPSNHRTFKPESDVASDIMCRTQYEVTSPVTWYIVHQPIGAARENCLRTHNAEDQASSIFYAHETSAVYFKIYLLVISLYLTMQQWVVEPIYRHCRAWNTSVNKLTCDWYGPQTLEGFLYYCNPNPPELNYFSAVPIIIKAWNYRNTSLLILWRVFKHIFCWITDVTHSHRDMSPF